MKQSWAAGGTLSEVIIRTPAAADGCYPSYDNNDFKIITTEAFIDTSYYEDEYEHGICWSKTSDNTKLKFNEKFTFADTYYVHVVVKASNGYTLPTGYKAYKFKFRGSELAEAAYIQVLSDDRVIAAYDYTAKSPWKAINIEIKEPAAGEQVYKNVQLVNQDPQNSFYMDFVNEIDISGTWYESKDGKNYSLMNATDVYKEGYHYKTLAPEKVLKYLKKYFLSEASGEAQTDLTGAYGVSDKITIEVNEHKGIYNFNTAKWEKYGEIADESFVNGYLTMPETKVPVSDIRIYGYNPPTTGEERSYDNFTSAKPGEYEIYTGSDSSFMKNGITWGQSKGGSNFDIPVSSKELFEKDKAYYICIHVRAVKAEGFSSNIKNIKAKIGNYDADVSVSEISDDILVLTLKKVAHDPVTAFNYTIPAPVPGEKPDKIGFNTTPENALITSCEVDSSNNWQVSDDGITYRSMKNAETGEVESFVEGKYYRTNITNSHYTIAILLYMLGKLDFNESVSYKFGNIQVYINGRKSTEEGVLDANGYVVFKCVKPKDGGSDGKEGGSGNGENGDGKQGGSDGTDPAKDLIDGVGTISPNGKYLTDEDGKKYRTSEKVKATELKPNMKIADKKTGGKYRITKVVKDPETGLITGGNVEYMAPYNKNCKLISATGIVKLGGVKFKVTSIAANCAKGCKKLNKVIIGSYISNIGKNAFSGCSKLKTVTFKGSRLKKVGANAFKGINKKATISVPKAKKKAYTKLLKGKGQAKTVKIK
ncbi:MAG: leucine-rich repeat domain-containing protein [Eubacterium sp.]|nr:leucine-rich repeat domain-containing protein [Eubacterium sp.]